MLYEINRASCTLCVKSKQLAVRDYDLICAVAGQNALTHTNKGHLHTRSSNGLGNEGAKSLALILPPMQSLKSVDLRCLNAAKIIYDAQTSKIVLFQIRWLYAMAQLRY